MITIGQVVILSGLVSSGKTYGQMSHLSPAFNKLMSTCVPHKDYNGPGCEFPNMNYHSHPVVERANPDGENIVSE